MAQPHAPFALPDHRPSCRRCEGRVGFIVTSGGQDVVRCDACNNYLYCAPRTETGRAQRTLSTRPGITPAQRYRVLERCGHRCVACGAMGDLQMAHLIAREDAEREGFLDEVIDSDLNLAAMCPECNSGQRPQGSVAVTLMYRCLLLATRKTA